MRSLSTKSILATMIFLLLFSTSVKSEEIVPESGQATHSVVTGDTLWDISGGFYKNPFLWPILWARNPEIKNPHLIYPEDQINLMPIEQKKRIIEKVVVKEVVKEVIVEVEPEEEVIEVAAIEPEVVMPEVKIVEPPREPTISDLIDANGLHSAGYVSYTYPEILGVIQGGLENRHLLEKGAMAYIDKGAGDGIKEGDTFTVVYIEEKEVREGVPSNYFIIKILGEISIHKTIDDSQSLALITKNYGEIERGNALLPTFDVDGSTKITDAVPDVDGLMVIAAKDDNRTSGHRSIVYLNKGAQDGLIAGQQFNVFRPEYTGKHPFIEDAAQGFPQERIGQATVIYTASDTATAVVTKTKGSIYENDKEIAGSDNLRKHSGLFWKR